MTQPIKLSGEQKFLGLLVLALVFILVYSPHFNYPWPYHVDEWHHLREALRLEEGGYFEFLQTASQGFSGLEIGFHIFLFGLGKVFNLISIYKFLPAVWATLSALSLFYVAYRKTGGNFTIAWLALIFLAALKSNVNIMGLWFFTPLTFAIPFIFLYVYFFTEGVSRRNNRYLLGSLALMIFLLPFHAISVLFMAPALVIYCLVNYRTARPSWRPLSLFLLVPVSGLLFYGFITNLPFKELSGQLFSHLIFQRGWGVLELTNSPSEVYGWFGYLLALVGVAAIIYRRRTKKYLIFLLWPAVMLALIAVYRISGVSWLSPYQRNLYYLALGLPLLSAIGAYYILEILKSYLKFRPALNDLIIALVTLVLAASVFVGYYQRPEQVDLYRAVERRDYPAIKFLAGLPPTKVMATPLNSTALYQLTGQTPVGTLTFYGKKKITREFFTTADCRRKKEIIKNEQVAYVWSPLVLDCDWPLLYQAGGNYIYQTNNLAND